MAFANSHNQGKGADNDCERGRAGPLTTIALLGKKPAVSAENFSSYWRDIHGTLATRIPGFWSYRQYHIDEEVTELRRFPIGIDLMPEELDGFADVSFCSEEDIAGLSSSLTAELIKSDEQNVFSYSYLYSALPGDSLTIKNLAIKSPAVKNPLGFPASAATTGDQSFIFLLSKPARQDMTEFKTSVTARVGALSQHCTGLVRIRANFFAPYDATAWPAPNVNHQPRHITDAAVELSFSHRDDIRECFSAIDDSNLAGAQGLQFAYRVKSRYAMVESGQATLIGLRGLPALQLIRKLGADNQTSEPVLQALYGIGQK